MFSLFKVVCASALFGLLAQVPQNADPAFLQQDQGESSDGISQPPEAGLDSEGSTGVEKDSKGSTDGHEETSQHDFGNSGALPEGTEEPTIGSSSEVDASAT